jgi:hypothetical protein
MPAMLAVLAALVAGACAAPAPRLGATETFTWSRQPITFAPPPALWYRDGHGGSGMRGVRFTLAGSVGEWMYVAENYLVAERDARERLVELRDHFESYDDRDLRRALALARYRTDDPISESASRVADDVNAALDEAMTAHLNGDPVTARQRLDRALETAEKLHYTLDEVVERVAFRPERLPEPERVTIASRHKGQLAGREAVFLDYTYAARERTYRGREVYVLEGTHLFAAGFFGLPSHLELFDRVVATIDFPKELDHAPPS